MYQHTLVYYQEKSFSRNIPKDKFPCDRLNKFYHFFWNDVKATLVYTLRRAYHMIYVLHKDKQSYVFLKKKTSKNEWRLNVDTQPFLPFLLSTNQAAYVKEAFAYDGGQLISDIMDTTKFRGLLITADFQKAFYFFNHLYLIPSIEKYNKTG